ncbi:MAG: ROK family protein [Candidatus Helarchaeota archaeon]
MDNRPTIGLDIGGTKIRGAIIDSYGNIINNLKIIKFPSKRSKKIFEKCLFECLDDLINNFAKLFPDLKVKIGIGSAGPLSTIDGILYSPENIGCGEYNIQKRVKETFPAEKVSLINDCEAIALGYYKYAPNKEQGLECSALGLIAPGTGLGAAMILNGMPYWGGKRTGYLAVELSKTPYFGSNKDEVQARIGSNLEDFASGMAVYPILMKIFGGSSSKIVSNQIKKTRKEERAWMIEQFARPTKSKEFIQNYPAFANFNVDKNCLLAYKNLGKHIGYAIAAFITNFNPDILILEGSIMNAYDLFKNEMMSSFKSSVYPEHRKIPIIKGSLSNAGVKGASYFVRL